MNQAFIQSSQHIFCAQIIRDKMSITIRNEQVTPSVWCQHLFLLHYVKNYAIRITTKQNKLCCRPSLVCCYKIKWIRKSSLQSGAIQDLIWFKELQIKESVLWYYEIRWVSPSEMNKSLLQSGASIYVFFIASKIVCCTFNQNKTCHWVKYMIANSKSASGEGHFRRSDKPCVYIIVIFQESLGILLYSANIDQNNPIVSKLAKDGALSVCRHLSIWRGKKLYSSSRSKRNEGTSFSYVLVVYCLRRCVVRGKGTIKILQTWTYL